MTSDATLSTCGKYRHVLRRIWNVNLPYLAVCMLNPSTADAEKDDNTIRKVIKFARRWGYGGIVVVNLFDWRATDPKELVDLDAPCSVENDVTIVRWCRGHDVFVGWGAGKFQEPRAQRARMLLKEYAKTMFCIGLTESGAPRHPLYCPDNSERIPWPPARKENLF